tara:strand:+ start:794 stop:1090 length:297 start_codon:yes stop_codon:yes gene_type:complete
LGSAFFGLTLQYRANLFKQIHEILFHGKGGYSYVEVYNFPIWLRNFTYNSIVEFYEKEKEEYDKSSKSSSGQSFDPMKGQKVPDAVKKAAQKGRISYK